MTKPSVHTMNDTCTQLHTMQVVRTYCELRGLSQMNAMIMQNKKNRTSAHSSTSFSVASPPSCKLSLHGCRDVGDPKRAHANTHFIIPLHTHNGTTRARVATSREKRHCGYATHIQTHRSCTFAKQTSQVIDLSTRISKRTVGHAR